MVRSAASLAVVLACAVLPPEVAASPRWQWPVRGELLTAYRYSGVPYAEGDHRGIDVAAPVGSPVLAAAPGTVRFAGVVGSSGLVVSVRTADGRFDTSYLHLSTASVRAGQAVAAGGPLGTVGASGSRSAAASHLHFGVRVAGSRGGYRDPLDLLPPLTRVRDAPRGVPVLSPSRLGRAPAPVPASPTAPFARLEPAAPPAPEGIDHGWAIACAALILAAASIGARPSRSSIGRHAVLRHHADLLRQR